MEVSSDGLRTSHLISSLRSDRTKVRAWRDMVSRPTTQRLSTQTTPSMHAYVNECGVRPAPVFGKDWRQVDRRRFQFGIVTVAFPLGRKISISPNRRSFDVRLTDGNVTHSPCESRGFSHAGGRRSLVFSHFRMAHWRSGDFGIYAEEIRHQRHDDEPSFEHIA